MEPWFTAEQEAFRSELRRFGAEQLAPHYQADDRTGVLRPELRRAMAGLGLLGLRIPEEYGGQGADCVTTGLAEEEVAIADFNASYLILLTVLCSQIIVDAADDRQKAQWLPQIANGEHLPALALTEPDHGSDAARLGLRAVRDGAGWRLEGEKTSITFGAYAETAVVFARTGGEGARGVSAFYVPLDERYVSRSAFADLGSRSTGRAALHFDGLPAPAGTLIGAEGAGFVQVMQGFDYSRALIGLMCVGCASASMAEAWEYVKQRQAFGQPIGRFQGVAFPLVEHETLLRGARHLCYEALWKKDRGQEHAVESNMAKWFAPKIAVEAAHQALLTFGHAGWSEESPLPQRMRDIIGLEIGDGTAQIAKLVVARRILGREYAP
ncbi:MAG: acyl-CoA dehydrogenase family protein [Acidimicrobiales bacterium]